MIYWRIQQPGKSWATWSDGTAADEDEAKTDALMSVMDNDTCQLHPWAQSVRVEMWRMVDIEDYRINETEAKALRERWNMVEA